MQLRRSQPTFATIPTPMGNPIIHARFAGDRKASASVARTHAVVVIATKLTCSKYR